MDEVAWCGVANLAHPDIVRQVHSNYLRAGADVITANTFATARHVLSAVGLGDKTKSINRQAVKLVREAIEEAEPQRPILVAGSLSNTLAWQPGTVVADPTHRPKPKQESDNYCELADTLAEAGVDVLLMEMMQDIEHSTRLMKAARRTGLPVWLGISVSEPGNGHIVGWKQSLEEPKDRLTPDFERSLTPTLETIFDALVAYEPQVVGIMHSSPRSTTQGLDLLRERWDGPVLAYPEARGFDFTRQEILEAVTEKKFVEQCLSWAYDGVHIIGGCCGTTVNHISALVDALTRAGLR